jgi:hypothetical protein
MRAEIGVLAANSQTTGQGHNASVKHRVQCITLALRPLAGPLLSIIPPFGSAHRERGIRTGKFGLRDYLENNPYLFKRKIILEKRTYFDLFLDRQIYGFDRLIHFIRGKI